MALGVSPFGYGPEPGVCYEAVKDDWDRRYDPPIDNSIDWSKCDTCGNRRAYEVRQGNWIDEGRRDGWLRYNAPGQPGSDKFVTRECDLVVEGGGIVAGLATGRLGQICPRKIGQAACPSPSSTPLPSPLPSPSPSSTPPPSDDDACKLGPDGNYPVPPEGTCPACWRADSRLISWWGVAFRSKVPCGGESCPYGVKINVDITPHSDKPYLRHRTGPTGGGGSETWPGCQPCDDPSNPTCRAAIPEIWVYPPGAEAGLCDPFSGSLYWCHHKPQAGQGGPTKFEVHQPPYRSIIVNVP